MLKPPKIKVFDEEYPFSVFVASVMAVAMIYLFYILLWVAFGPTPTQ